MTHQTFLTQICWKYEEASRATLQWYARDPSDAVRFLVGFLVKLNGDIDVARHDFKARQGVLDGLKSPGTSVCRVAFLRFCELLYESPSLIDAVQSDSAYQHGIGGADVFKNRDSNGIALTRGTSWEAAGFGNPNPLPFEVIAGFHEQQRRQHEQEVLRRDRESQRVREIREAKKRALAPIIEQRRQASRARAVFRASFREKPCPHQLCDLAVLSDHPLTAFPFDPLSVHDDDLKSLDREILELLARRLKTRWEKRWKALLARVLNILDADAQERR